MNMTQTVLAYLQASTSGDLKLSSADVAAGLGIHVDSVASVLSKLHKAHTVRAESIWVPGKTPYTSYPLLHYFVSKK